MKVHYFQRYHSKENVVTANTMLLLSRLYSYSSDKFFALLKSEFFQDADEIEMNFKMQESNGSSIPDAVISQPSFKIVVETKLSDWFHTGQLENHLKSFANEDIKVLLSLAPEPMNTRTLQETNEAVHKYNKNNNTLVQHINTTFEAIVQAIQDVLSDNDYEMKAVLDDFYDFCISEDLIIVSDSWKYMMMQLAGTTIDFNLKEGLYYKAADKSFRAHDYVGLYNQKSIRAIGKIKAIVNAIETGEGVKFEAKRGEVTDEIEEKIKRAIKDGENYGYNLHTVEHTYFIVDKFCVTDYRKISKYPPMGPRKFELASILNIADENSMPNLEDIAKLLKKESWT